MKEMTKEKLSRLRRLYDKAVREKRQVIVFEGNEYITSYVKYLLEYYESKFNTNGNTAH